MDFFLTFLGVLNSCFVLDCLLSSCFLLHLLGFVFCFLKSKIIRLNPMITGTRVVGGNSGIIVSGAWIWFESEDKPL